MRCLRRPRRGQRPGGQGLHRAGQGHRGHRGAEKGDPELRQEAHRALQVSPHRGIPGEPAQDHQRQDPPYGPAGNEINLQKCRFINKIIQVRKLRQQVDNIHLFVLLNHHDFLFQ